MLGASIKDPCPAELIDNKYAYNACEGLKGKQCRSRSDEIKF